VLERSFARIVSGIGVSLEFCMIPFFFLRNGLKMVVRGGDVSRSGKVMLLASHVVLSVRHEILLNDR